MADDTPQTGLITNKLGNFSENDSVDITPESSVLETTDWFSALKTSARAIGAANATLGTVDDYGRQTSAPEPDVDPKTLQEEYPQLPGKPAFDKPMPDSVARGIYEHQQDEVRIADAIARRPDGFWNGAARYGTQFAADLLDPLNIASMFVPVVGEGAFVAEGAGLAARLGGRIAAGAINADIGQVPLIALKYGQSKIENDDYGAVSAMSDLAIGAGMGAVFHGAITGPITDYLARRVARSPVQTALEADPALRQSALNTAISQAATDAPVEVRPVFDAAGLHAATDARDNFLNDAAAVENIVPGSPAALRIQAIDEELGGSQRLAAIDAELGGVIPAARRAELETERTLVTEGEQLPSLEHLKALHEERDHIIALETARAEAQRSGLLEGATKSEADITSHLQAKHAEDFATLEQMAKDAGTDVHAIYQSVATPADAKLEDMERAYQQIRASEAASNSARGGEQPGVPGPNAPAGTANPGEVGGAAQPVTAGGADVAVPGAGPAGGAGAAEGAGSGAAGRAGPITPSMVQRRDGVGFNEAYRRAQSENAALALKAQTAATEAQRAADGVPSAAEAAVTKEAQAAAKVQSSEALKAAAADIESHTQFFQGAEAAGVLTDADRAALQSLSGIDENAKSLTSAAMQAAACIARGLA